MRGKICLVTGATSGIGFETAVGLAERGATVLLAGPDPIAAEWARQALRTRVPGAVAFAYAADLARMIDIRMLAAEVLERHARLDVLINNAGIYADRRASTADGYEATLAVNFLAPFLLTSLLWSRMCERADGRVINVGSIAHVAARFDLDDPHFERRRYHGFSAYAASKLAILCFTRELAARSGSPAPTCNALHPGIVGTALVRNAGHLGRMFGWATPVLGTARRAASTALHVACAPELEGTTGGWFVRSRLRPPPVAANDRALACRIWELAVHLTGARWSDREASTA